MYWTIMMMIQSIDAVKLNCVLIMKVYIWLSLNYPYRHKGSDILKCIYKSANVDNTN